MRAFAACALLVACVDPAESLTPPIAIGQAGARLVPRGVEFPGGARSIVDWYDLALGFPCTFVAARRSSEPGWDESLGDVFYCLPAQTAAPRGTFFDAECQAPIDELLIESAGDARWVVDARADPDQCGAPIGVYEVGEPIDAARKPQGGCAPFRPRRIGAAVPLDHFVRLVLAADQGARISAAELVGEDGARISTGLGYDRELATLTRPDKAADGVSRWLPAGIRVAYSYAAPILGHPSGLFAGADCRVPLATKDANPCLRSASFIFEFLADDCGGYRFPTIYRAGAEQAEAYFAGEAGCARAPPPSWPTRYYPFLDEQTPDRLAPVAPVERRLGQGRIRLAAAVADGGPIVSTRFIDTTFESPCAPEATPDGVTRCVPLDAPIEYTDAGCEAPVLAEVPPACGALGAPPKTVREATGKYYTVGDPAAPAKTWAKRSEACVEVDPTGRAAARFHALETIGWSTLEVTVAGP